MTRVHFSAKPLGPLYDVRPDGEGTTSPFAYKPLGLWYSVNGDWERWCLADGCEHWIAGTCRYALDVSGANLLVLTRAADVIDFSRRYETAAARYGIRAIDWGRVGAAYDGIEIVPYQWGCRMHDDCRWYDGWGCASGVVWRATKLTATPIVEVQPAAAAGRA
jgi:hypothetical protein